MAKRYQIVEAFKDEDLTPDQIKTLTKIEDTLNDKS